MGAVGSAERVLRIGGKVYHGKVGNIWIKPDKDFFPNNSAT